MENNNIVFDLSEETTKVTIKDFDGNVRTMSTATGHFVKAIDDYFSENFEEGAVINLNKSNEQ